MALRQIVCEDSMADNGSNNHGRNVTYHSHRQHKFQQNGGQHYRNRQHVQDNRNHHKLSKKHKTSKTVDAKRLLHTPRIENVIEDGTIGLADLKSELPSTLNLLRNEKEEEIVLNPSRVENRRRVSKQGVEETIKLIEKHISTCQQNYDDIHSKINSTFSTLILSLNERKKSLVQRAKFIRDRKIKSLSEIKEKNIDLLNSSTLVKAPLTEGTHGNYVNNGLSSTRVDGENTSLLNGLHEHQDEREIVKNVKISRTSLDLNCGRGSLSGIEEDLNDYANICPAKLEEGNMTICFDEKQVYAIGQLGQIREDLSSSQFSSTKGLNDSFGIIGDKVNFEVHTRNVSGEMNWNVMDKVDICIYDSSKSKVSVKQASSAYEEGITSNDDTITNEKCNNGVYCYSFLPLSPGPHNVSIKLNGIEISTSPFIFIAHPKLDLTFMANDFCQSMQSLDISRCKDHEKYLTTSDFPEIGWIIQKDKKSILLQSLSSDPSSIYGSEVVSAMCAWHIRLTTACMNIVLSVGVKTRSGIPDIDEEFSCKFHLDTFAGTSYALDKANRGGFYLRRQTSSYTRVSFTFTVFINEGFLRVTCRELNEDKRVEIDLIGAFSLHPFCSMVHDHEDDVSRICPRPQLTFL